MENLMITVPYGDFVDGQKAIADLESIRAILSNGIAYCSESILSVLGLPVKNERELSFKEMLSDEDAGTD